MIFFKQKKTFRCNISSHKISYFPRVAYSNLRRGCGYPQFLYDYACPQNPPAVRQPRIFLIKNGTFLWLMGGNWESKGVQSLHSPISHSRHKSYTIFAQPFLDVGDQFGVEEFCRMLLVAGGIAVGGGIPFGWWAGGIGVGHDLRKGRGGKGEGNLDDYGIWENMRQFLQLILFFFRFSTAF